MKEYTIVLIDGTTYTIKAAHIFIGKDQADAVTLFNQESNMVAVVSLAQISMLCETNLLGVGEGDSE